MSPRAARQIRAGIVLARQVNRNERLGPRSRPGAYLTATAYLRTIAPRNRPLWAYAI